MTKMVCTDEGDIILDGDQYVTVTKDLEFVTRGTELTDFRGDTAVFKRIAALESGPKQGKVSVTWSTGHEGTYYASVFDLRVRKLDDVMAEITARDNDSE